MPILVGKGKDRIKTTPMLPPITPPPTFSLFLMVLVSSSHPQLYKPGFIYFVLRNILITIPINIAHILILMHFWVVFLPQPEILVSE